MKKTKITSTPRKRSAGQKDKFISPQDPLKGSFIIQTPQTSSSMNFTNQRETPSSTPLSSQKSMKRIMVSNSRNTSLNQSTPILLNQHSPSSPLLGLNHPYFSKSLNIKQEAKIVNIDVNFDDFFCTLSTQNYISSIEMFISSNLNSQTTYWEEVTSIQYLVSDKLHMAIPHNKSLVGFAYSQRKIVVVPVARDHQAYDEEIDINVVNPLSLVIFVPLIDYKNQIVALLEIVKRHNDTKVKDYEYNFVETFQKKFKAFSSWILQTKIMDDLLFSLIEYNDLAQFILNFQEKMNNLFDTNNSELWHLKESDNIILYKGVDKLTISKNKSGIVSDIIKKGQLFNSSNSRLQSSYNPDVDEDECPVLGIPVTASNQTIVIVLRGKNSNQVFSATNERCLIRIAPYVAAGFAHAFNSSSAPNDSIEGILISQIPKPHHHENAKELINLSMQNIIRLTNADRATLYLIEKDKLISIFHSGLKKNLTIPIGQGHAGIAAQRGTVINVNDAYRNDAFDSSYDKTTGYKTTSLLTVPILNLNRSIISVIQLLNKKGGIPFSNSDINFCKLIGSFCSLLLDDSRLANEMKDKLKRVDLIFQTLLSSSLNPKQDLIEILLQSLRTFFNTDQCNLYVYNDAEKLFIKPSAYYKGFYQNKTMNFNQSLQEFDIIPGDNKSALACYQKKEAFYVNEVENDIRTTGEKFQNICIAPLISRPDGEAIGFIRIVNSSDPFNDNDLNTLQLISSIASLLICEMKLTKYFISGPIQLKIDKIISVNERGKFHSPVNLQLEANFAQRIKDIDFSVFQVENLHKIIFYSFDLYNLMEAFSIPCEKLYLFLLKIDKLYEETPFHSFMHAVDMLQFFMHIMTIGHMDNFLHKEEILVFILACIAAYIKTDETTNKFQKQAFTPISLLYKEKPIQINKCSKLLHVLENPSCNIFEFIESDKLKECWELLFKLLNATDQDSIIETINNLKYIATSAALDLNNISHRQLLLTVLFEVCQFGYIARPFDICQQWFLKEKEELISLQQKEINQKFHQSSLFTTDHLINSFSYEISTIRNIGIPLFTIASSYIGDFHVLGEHIKRNLHCYENK